MSDDTKDTARDATWPVIGDCPTWCATDHAKWKYTHESEHTPLCNYPLMTAAYAVGMTDLGPDDHRVSVYGRDLTTGPRNTMSLNFSDPQEARNFASLLELLAQSPEQLVQLAAQVRTAAMAISGETS